MESGYPSNLLQVVEEKTVVEHVLQHLVLCPRRRLDVAASVKFMVGTRGYVVVCGSTRGYPGRLPSGDCP